MNPEEFSKSTVKILDRLIDVALSNKILHSNSETARHWAIFRTELEKLKAYYKTYLSDEKESPDA